MQEIDKIQWPGWRVVRLIGRGSFGAVYEIERDVFGEIEKAALKVITIPENGGDIEDLRVEGYDDASITSRFQGYLEDIVKEYSTMAKMKGHPNVVYCDDVKYIQHDDGIGWDIFIKMELLTPIMKCLDRIENEQSIIDLGISMCNALVLCRERSIVHRDIKPQNIFLSQDGTFKLGDFGIAKTAERTTSGTKVGTYKYMAPEVYNNRPYGPAADQYSLGLVMYWLLNDRRTPFSPKRATASEEDEARKRRFDGEQIPPPAHGSKELQAIVLKACAYDPKQRFASAAEMLNALKSLQNGTLPEGAFLSADQASPAAEAIPAKASDLTEKAPAAVVLRAAEDMTVGVAAASAARNPAPGPVPLVGEEASPAPEAPVREQVSSASGKAGIPNEEDLSGNASPSEPAGQDLTVRASLDQSGRDTADATIGAYSAIGSREPGDQTVGAFQNGAARRKGQKKPAESAKSTPATGAVGSPNAQKTAVAAHPILVEKEEERKKKRGFAAWIAIAAALAVIVGGVFLLLGKDKNPDTGTAGTEAVRSAAETVPSTTEAEEILPVQLDWADWADELPDYVTDEHYVIEERTVYSSRQLESAESKDSDQMDGWELYDTAEGNGEFGAWSDWSQTAATASDTREAETQTRYRYSDKETTTGSSSAMNGWTLESTTNDWGKYGSWSEWSTTAVSKSDSRDVETKTQYRYRDKETKTSSSSTLSGWTLENTTYSYGNYGAWSDWSTTAVSGSDNREVQTETRYRYRDKETKTSTSSNLSGWTKYDEKTSWSDYGSWSDWSTSAVSESDSRQVETKTQYSYREKLYTSSSDSYLSGWTGYSSSVEYGPWSAWTDSYISESDTREVDYREVEDGTRYHLSHYCNGSYVTCPLYEDGITYHDLGWFDNLSLFKAEGSAGSWTLYCYYPNGSRYRCSNTCYYWYITDTSTKYKTQYRYRDIYRIYYYYKWDNWSSYSDNYVSENSDREVQTRTLYRSRSRNKNITYYFYRWKDWSSWSTTAVSANDNREVQTAKYYRYRDRTSVPTYHFYRWKDWSSWSANAVSGSANREVQTATYYRYRDRASIPTYHFSRWKDWSAWSETAVSETASRKVETTTFYRYRDRVTETTYYFRRWTDWSDYTESPAEESETVEVRTKTQYRYRSK